MRVLTFAFIMLVPVFTFSVGAEEPNGGEAYGAIERFFAQVRAGQAFEGSKFVGPVTSRSVDLNDTLNLHFDSGLAYAARVEGVVDLPLTELRKRLSQPHALRELVQRIKTLRRFEDVREVEHEVTFKVAVKVPVIADFKTEERVRVVELNEEHDVIESTQVGTYGDLAYNRCDLILHAAGAHTEVMGLGVHILRPERKVPWLGRGGATSFARTHYANYIVALKTLEKADVPK